jgi:hypothetical protein
MPRRRERAATSWIPDRGLDDAVLACEALQEELVRRSRRRSDVFWRLLGGLGGTNGVNGTMGNKLFGGPTYPYYGGGAASVAGDFARGLAADRKACLELAVHEVVRTLNAPERVRLRSAGILPTWFLEEVERSAAVIKRELRRAR